MKTTVTENPAEESLREELRQTAISAFENDAIDAISLKSALQLSCSEEAANIPPYLVGNKTNLQRRIEAIQAQIHQAEVLKAKPESEQHAKFIFHLYREPIDIRPILELIEHYGITKIASIVDTVMFKFIHQMPENAFDEDSKENFFTMRRIRDAFLTAGNIIELDSWLERRSKEVKEQDKVEFNERYFGNIAS
ncbi:hypothetical protein [Adhaeribacter pallidiroseus]|uniref:Uncharacterized protein n=1 Tax=Adhaeribacter pallidiroseus TaxID=2072847 RepID=A0A369QN10_9BACT|nr:hypothetical protein [Adhaeribacter pallidiroseus]RDC64636.1 hypothetical protein AHMF7616_03252 [Adhaeribacter pallidiroseus]